MCAKLLSSCFSNGIYITSSIDDLFWNDVGATFRITSNNVSASMYTHLNETMCVNPFLSAASRYYNFSSGTLFFRTRAPQTLSHTTLVECPWPVRGATRNPKNSHGRFVVSPRIATTPLSPFWYICVNAFQLSSNVALDFICGEIFLLFTIILLSYTTDLPFSLLGQAECAICVEIRKLLI